MFTFVFYFPDLLFDKGMGGKDLLVMYLHNHACQLRQNFIYTGYEPHKLVRHHPRSPIRIVHSSVLRPRLRPASAWTAACERDGRPAATAQRLPQLSGPADRDSASNTALLSVYRQDSYILQVGTFIDILDLVRRQTRRCSLADIDGTS